MGTGFFQLKDASDLFKKLEWEYRNLRDHPGNQYHAFNFFVTAEHMADWMNESGIDIDKKDFTLLKLCSHIANSGKHFVAKAERHKSVKSAMHDGIFEPGVFEVGVFEESLQIELTPEEAKKLCVETIDSVSLASKVLEFWRARM